MNDKTYDLLKELAQVWIPAAGTLYFALAKIWGFPYGPEVVATLTAIDTFMGALLHISSNSYNAAMTAEEKNQRMDAYEEEPKESEEHAAETTTATPKKGA